MPPVPVPAVGRVHDRICRGARRALMLAGRQGVRQSICGMAAAPTRACSLGVPGRAWSSADLARPSALPVTVSTASRPSGDRPPPRRVTP